MDTHGLFGETGETIICFWLQFQLHPIILHMKMSSHYSPFHVRLRYQDSIRLLVETRMACHPKKLVFRKRSPKGFAGWHANSTFWAKHSARANRLAIRLAMPKSEKQCHPSANYTISAMRVFADRPHRFDLKTQHKRFPLGLLAAYWSVSAGKHVIGPRTFLIIAFTLGN